MKALVTGATGFIGSSVVRELLRQGAQVRVLLRKSSNIRAIDGLSDVEKVYGDVCDQASMEAALKGRDVFFQTAALLDVWGYPKKEYYRVNVEGTRTSLDAAMKAGVQRVVHTSSIASLGCHDKDHPGNENSAFNLWNAKVHYCTSKYLGEMEAIRFAEKGLPLVVVNPSLVIGVGDIKPTPSGRNIVDILNGRVPGYPDAGGNYVDVEDVAKGHILAAEKGKVGERYVLGNANLSMKDFMGLVAGAGGVKVPRLKLPPSAVVAMAYFYALKAAITRKAPVVTPSMARILPRCMYFDTSKAVAELGFPQTPIGRTVDKAVQWFRDNGYAKPAKKAVLLLEADLSSVKT